MAPLRASRYRGQQYDNTPGSNRRQGGVIDHDPTEGLPVRKWEQQFVTIKQDQKSEADPPQGPNPDYPWPELPLPKDFHQLPAHSQEMLRRARMGNRAKPSSDASAAVDDDAAGEDSENKPAIVKEDRSYTVRRWAPARVEKPDAKYLADRRPGLPPLYGLSAQPEVTLPAKKMVKVRTTDPVTGQQRIFDTMILEGGESSVEGEIITEEEAAAAIATSTSETKDTEAAPGVMTESLAPGTVVEGVGVVNEDGVVVAPSVAAAAAAVAEATPVRRRPPPPKRKKHGPGRGRKKIIVAKGEGIDATSSAMTPGDATRSVTEGPSQPSASVDGKTPITLDGAGDDREDSTIQDEGDGNDESGDEEGSEEGEIEEEGEEGQVEDTIKEPAETTAVPPAAPKDLEPNAPEPVQVPQPEVSDSAPLNENNTGEAPQVDERATEAAEAGEAHLTTENAPVPESKMDIDPLPTTTEPKPEPEPEPTLDLQSEEAPNNAPPPTDELPVEKAAEAPENETKEAETPSAPGPPKTESEPEPEVGELDLLGNLEKTLDNEDAGATS